LPSASLVPVFRRPLNTAKSGGLSGTNGRSMFPSSQRLRLDLYSILMAFLSLMPRSSTSNDILGVGVTDVNVGLDNELAGGEVFDGEILEQRLIRVGTFVGKVHEGLREVVVVKAGRAKVMVN
jgi:hypothetical protein